MVRGRGPWLKEGGQDKAAEAGPGDGGQRRQELQRKGNKAGEGLNTEGPQRPSTTGPAPGVQPTPLQNRG